MSQNGHLLPLDIQFLQSALLRSSAIPRSHGLAGRRTTSGINIELQRARCHERAIDAETDVTLGVPRTDFTIGGLRHGHAQHTKSGAVSGTDTAYGGVSDWCRWGATRPPQLGIPRGSRRASECRESVFMWTLLSIISIPVLRGGPYSLPAARTSCRWPSTWYYLSFSCRSDVVPHSPGADTAESAGGASPARHPRYRACSSPAAQLP